MAGKMHFFKVSVPVVFGWFLDSEEFLGGGVKYFLFSPLQKGRWSNLTNIFKWIGSTAN